MRARVHSVGLWYDDADDRLVVRCEAREGVSLVTGGLGVRAGPASRECPVFGPWYVELTADGSSFRASRVARYGRSRQLVTLVAFASDEEFRRDPVEARASARTLPLQ